MRSALIASILSGTIFAAASPAGRGSVHEQVKNAGHSLRSHSRAQDYHASPYHPTAIVERIHAMESNAAWSSLCKELTALPDDELELFEDEIRKPDHVGRLTCSGALLQRLDAYWRAAGLRLAEAHPLTTQPQLESDVVGVDVARSAALFGLDLAPDQIALTFDDGPHPTRTPRILKILSDAGVKATFFEIGRNAAAHPEIVREVAAAGHSIGSHTWSHPNLERTPEHHAEVEIDSGDAGVSLVLGLAAGQLPFFRFPYGSRTPAELNFVQKRGNAAFFWNMDSADWRIRDPRSLFLNVLRELDRAGHGIILFHDIHEQTVVILPHVLAELRARHLRTVVFIPSSTPRALPDVNPSSAGVVP